MAEIRYPTIIISAKDEATPVLKKAGMEAISFADQVRNALTAQSESHARAQAQAAKNAGLTVKAYQEAGKAFVAGGATMNQSGTMLTRMFGTILPGAIGRTVQTLGTAYLTFQSVQKAAGYAYESFQKFAEFDSQMRDLKFSAGVGNKEMDRLADSIKAIGRITATNASQIGTAYDVLSKRTGAAHDDVMKMLPDIARFSAAMKMVPEQLADTYGDMARNLDIPVNKTREALEILFAARSKLGVEIDKVDLSELTADAKKMGYQGTQGLIQYMTMLSSLNDTFGDTRKSVQALRGFMDEMVSDRVSTAMRGWGGALKQELREVVKGGGDVNAWWTNILNELINRQSVLDAMGKDSGRVAENFLKMLEGGMLSKQRILEAARTSTAGYDAGTEQLKASNAELKRMKENMDQLSKTVGSLMDAFGATAAIRQLNSLLEGTRAKLNYIDKAWRAIIDGSEWPSLIDDEDVRAMKEDRWFMERFPGGTILRNRIERKGGQSTPHEPVEPRDTVPLERPLAPGERTYRPPRPTGGGPGAPRVGPYGRPGGYYSPSSYTGSSGSTYGSSSDSLWLPADFRHGGGYQNAMFGRGGGSTLGPRSFDRAGPAGGYGGGSGYGGGGGRSLPAAPGGPRVASRGDTRGRTAESSEATGAPAGEDAAGAVRRVASEIGVSPEDLATVMSYETGGTMSPSKWGGRGGNYLGMIQFGPAERQKYGVHAGQSAAEQIHAAGRFLKDRGLARWLKDNPDASEEDKRTALYSTINAGSPGRQYWNRSDRPGHTVASHSRAMFAPGSRHRARARGYLGGADTATPPRPAERSSEVVAPGGGGGAVTHRGSGRMPEQSVTDAMAYAGAVAGVTTNIAHGDEGGHSRHRAGASAGDVDLYDETGHKLDANIPADRAKMAAYIEAAAAGGATGIGMGTGAAKGQPGSYMGPSRMHIGGGVPAVWGHRGRGGNEPQWVRDAYNRGRARQVSPQQRQATIERARAASAERARAAAAPRPTQPPIIQDDSGTGTATSTDIGGRRRDRRAQGFDPATAQDDRAPPVPSNKLYDMETGEWMIGSREAHPNDPLGVAGGNYPAFRRSENVSDERFDPRVRGYGQRRLGQRVGIDAKYNAGAREHMLQPVPPTTPLSRQLGSDELDDARYEKMQQSLNMNVNVNTASVQWAKRDIKKQVYHTQNEAAANTYYDTTTT
jgi:hypothetical protein